MALAAAGFGYLTSINYDASNAATIRLTGEVEATAGLPAVIRSRRSDRTHYDERALPADLRVNLAHQVCGAAGIAILDSADDIRRTVEATKRIMSDATFRRSSATGYATT